MVVARCQRLPRYCWSRYLEKKALLSDQVALWMKSVGVDVSGLRFSGVADHCDHAQRWELATGNVRLGMPAEPVLSAGHRRIHQRRIDDCGATGQYGRLGFLPRPPVPLVPATSPNDG